MILMESMEPINSHMDLMESMEAMDRGRMEPPSLWMEDPCKMHGCCVLTNAFGMSLVSFTVDIPSR